jgi:transcriptional antiterminator NusG
MWYATQVCTGREEKVISYCRMAQENGVIEDIFIPKCQVKKKCQGVWHVVNQVMFPGYIFIVANEVNRLFQYLKQIPELTKLLGTGNEIVPLESYEMAFLQHFTGEKHVVEMSEGYIIGDKVVITEGPMQGYEGCIKRIDRHKRIGVIEVEFFGRLIETKVGLEIVRRE